MKRTLKPYRYISVKELGFLEERLNRSLAVWNEDYAIEPLQLRLHCLSKENQIAPMLSLKQNEKSIALLDNFYLPFIKQSLFSMLESCFDEVSEMLFCSLLKQLFALDSLQLSNYSISSEDWFYPGSACLILILNNKNDCLKFYLHPHWVLSQLPRSNKGSSISIKPTEALAKEKIKLTIELDPLTLNLKQLINLQINDVIKTSHLLTKPLTLRSQNQNLCEVELSQCQQYKSVKLRRFS